MNDPIREVLERVSLAKCRRCGEGCEHDLARAALASPVAGEDWRTGVIEMIEHVQDQAQEAHDACLTDDQHGLTLTSAEIRLCCELKGNVSRMKLASSVAGGDPVAWRAVDIDGVPDSGAGSLSEERNRVARRVEILDDTDRGGAPHRIEPLVLGTDLYMADARGDYAAQVGRERAAWIGRSVDLFSRLLPHLSGLTDEADEDYTERIEKLVDFEGDEPTPIYTIEKGYQPQGDSGPKRPPAGGSSVSRPSAEEGEADGE